MGVKKKKKQLAAARYINEWISLGAPPATGAGEDGFAPVIRHRPADKLVFEFHSHSRCSDGYLSPTALIERAHSNGVKVLALTDHDTMAGIPEATEAAQRFGMKIIPGVEISAMYSARDGTEELVHILAYYGSCGPARYEELNTVLTKIRDGRYIRAQNMLSKLTDLKMPLEWEHIAKIAGDGVAPGRVHVARALVEAGYVENLKQAFSRYLCDNGPAYATGSEPAAETVVRLIRQTGGISVLAHPWASKNPDAIVKSLKAVGLHGMEVYRSDRKMDGFNDMADKFDLLKLGGSDFHGNGESESDLGSVNPPIGALSKFFKMARPVWRNAAKDVLQSFAESPSQDNLEKVVRFGKIKALNGSSSAPSQDNLEKVVRFGKIKALNGSSTSHRAQDVVELCLSSWLTDEERKGGEFELIRLKVLDVVFSHIGL